MSVTFFQAIVCGFLIFVVCNWTYFLYSEKCPIDVIGPAKGSVIGEEYLEQLKQHDYLFIGGFPRSGTTLLRVIIDSHPLIYCGPETRLLPTILRMIREFSSDSERARLSEAGIHSDLAERIFLLTLGDIVNSRVANGRSWRTSLKTCFKDPFTLRYTSYLANILPRAKFILIVRDGRAVVHSIRTRHIKISGLNTSDIESILMEWNFVTRQMVEQCLAVRKRCLILHYEKLVLYQKSTLKRILRFLSLPWDDAVLNHSESLNQQDGPVLSRYEPSYSQVIRPVYNTSLFKWILLPKDVLSKAMKIAPMLEALGYPAWSRV